MIKIINSKPIIGEVVILTSDNVDNWGKLVQTISDEEVYDVDVRYNNTTFMGNLTRYEEDGEVKYIVEFDQSVVLPSGTCLYVDVVTGGSMTNVCPDEYIEITKTSKLSVIGDDGCPIGYTTVADVLALITFPTLCELVGERGFVNGNLVAQDKILTTSGDCTMKAVPQSDICCD